jgi:hypothetical protein
MSSMSNRINLLLGPSLPLLKPSSQPSQGLRLWYHGEGEVAALGITGLQDREIVNRQDEMAGGL